MEIEKDIKSKITEGEVRLGEVVRLRSGGPQMTVTTVGPAGRCTCTWFDGQGGAMQIGDFPVVALTPDPTEDDQASKRPWPYEPTDCRLHRMPIRGTPIP